jgi:GNAT superfamily N-acetyltransferase
MEGTGLYEGRSAGVRIAPLVLAQMPQVMPLLAGYQVFYGAEPDHERNRKFFRRFLDPSPDGLLLGAWVGDELVGFACIYWTFSSINAREVALMSDLFVAEGHRGSGIGLSLIEASVEAARRRGSRHLEWVTAVDNLRAQRLYDRIPEAERSAWFGYEIPLS